MSVTFPEGVEGEGNINVLHVPAIADPDFPTTTELAAGVDITCYITGDGFNPGGSQVTNSDRRLCSRQTFESPGAISYTISELTYVYDPQAAGGSDPENEAYDTLVPGVSAYLVVRYGLPFETAFANGQIVDVFPVKYGAQIKNPPVAATTGGGGGGGTTKLTVRQTPYVVGPASLDAVIGGGS